MADTLSVTSKADLDQQDPGVARPLRKLSSRGTSQNPLSSKTPELQRSNSRSRKVSAIRSPSASSFLKEEDEAVVQTTIARAIVSGLSGAKYTGEKFETNQDVLTAILLNIVRKEQGAGISPIDFNNKVIVLMDLDSEKNIMKTFNLSISFQSRESFLKEYKKYKGNCEFVLGKGDELLFLKSVEGNVLYCINSSADTCPTFTVGNVDGGFYRVQLNPMVGGLGAGGQVRDSGGLTPPSCPSTP